MPTVKSQVGADQQDRSLTVIVTPTLVWRSDGSIGATFTFSQGASNPNMPSRVNPGNGNINLNGMPANRNFTDNVDITISLDTSLCKDRNGQNPVTVRWALNDSEGNPPDDVGYCWFVANPQPGQPKNLRHISIPGMTISRISDTTLLIDDNTPDSADTYTFCMGIVLPAYSNYYITIDPVISGKGTSTNSFMLPD